MKIWEKVFVICSVIYVTPLILFPSVWPAFLIDYYDLSNGQLLYMSMSIFGFILGIICLIITFRDLIKRDFKKNKKIMWTLILILGGTPGWIVYLFVHGFKPRITHSSLK